MDKKRRYALFGGASTVLLPVAEALAVGDIIWTSGGTNPFYPVPHRHQVAIKRFVQEGILTYDEGRTALSMAESGRGASDKDPIEDGWQFTIMAFGGGRGQPIQYWRNVIAKPSAWGGGSTCRVSVRDARDVPSSECTAKVYFISDTVGRDGEVTTKAYVDPYVCGNSSVIEWKAGRPVCVPLPPRGRYI